MKPRPPASNIVEYLEWLGDKVEAMDTARQTERINASQAARDFGLASNYFSRAPWRIPGFGGKGTIHTREEWAYCLASEAERRKEWDAMSAAERRKARGAA